MTETANLPGSCSAARRGRARHGRGSVRRGGAEHRLIGRDGRPPIRTGRAEGQRAVDDQVGAGDKARARAGEEHHRVRDLLRRSHAAGRVARDHRLEIVGIALLGDVPHPALEIDVAGRDHIGADVLPREVARQPLHIGDERRLDRRIGAGRAVHLGHRRAADDDDRAGGGFSRKRQRRLAAEHRRHHVDLEALAPGVLVHPLRQRADIGDKDVNPAERARRCADPVFQRRQIGDVHRAAPGLHILLFERRHRLGDRAGAARAQRDITTLLGQQIADRAADAARSAGDERLLPLQSQIHEGRGSLA